MNFSDYIEQLDQPWIAFKTLEVGAITPEVGFQYAFDNGADFIWAGMYDFQIVYDVNINLSSSGIVKRNRPWRVK